MKQIDPHLIQRIPEVVIPTLVEWLTSEKQPQFYLISDGRECTVSVAFWLREETRTFGDDSVKEVLTAALEAFNAREVEE